MLVTTAAGFLLGASGPVPLLALAQAVVGTGLVTAGAQALNQLLERRTDALMRRTAHRPLPAGRVRPREAFLMGLLLSACGVAVLGLTTNATTAGLAVLALAGYLLVYTPMKRRTALCTVIGAVPGATPVVMGWTAAGGDLGAGAIALFLILLAWQLPHFMAIAWIYREDYARAGFPLIAVLDPTGRRTAIHTLGWGAALVACSFLPSMAGLTGWIYTVGAAGAGLGFLACCASLARSRATSRARAVLVGSVIYLPVLMALMLLGRSGP